MTCFSWQLTHNITIYSVRLPLKECCLKINAKNVPTFADCHLATHPNSRSCGSGRICLLIFLLFVLETSQYQSCLCLEEVALFVRLDGEHPSSRNIISRFDLPEINKIENFIVNPGFVIQVFCFSELFVLASWFFNWGFLSCTGSPFLCWFLLPFRKSSYIVPTHLEFERQLFSFWNLHLYVTEVIGHLTEVQWSSYTRHGGQIASVLLISISVVKKWSGCCGILVFQVSLSNVGHLVRTWRSDKVLFFQSLDSVHCTHIAVLNVFITRINTSS